ncbi:MAG: hypothetical protein ABEJ85_03690 [Haloarculaceae archaeon]
MTRSHRRADGRGSLSTADAVLAVIPAWLVVAALVGAAFSLSLWTILAAGSVPATGTIGYALFYNPPEPVAAQE